jgi:Flp pilus assembly protein TadG
MKICHRRPSVRATRPGQSLTEFALIAPLLVAILLGIIELGIIFAVYTGLTNSAREAARAGAVYRYPGPAPNTGTLTTQPAIDAAAAPIDTARLLAMTETLSATLSPLIQVEQLSPLDDQHVTYPFTVTASNLYRAGEPISVTLSYTHTLLWGALGERELVLNANSAHRIEPGGN